LANIGQHENAQLPSKKISDFSTLAIETFDRAHPPTGRAV